MHTRVVYMREPSFIYWRMNHRRKFLAPERLEDAAPCTKYNFLCMPIYRVDIETHRWLGKRDDHGRGHGGISSFRNNGRKVFFYDGKLLDSRNGINQEKFVKIRRRNERGGAKGMKREKR